MSAQKIAVLAPEKTETGIVFAETLSASLAGKMKIIDSSLAETVFSSAAYENPYNLSLEEAINTGAAIGCDFFVLLKSANTRRESLDKPFFYESYAAVYLVSSRSGKLIFWKLQSFQAAKANQADKLLFDSASAVAGQISEKIKAAAKEELSEKAVTKIEEIPAENSPEAKNFRAPIPYKRIKPIYSSTAFLYDAKATVDVTVDIDADGAILRTEISRWAGFGLDESVVETIRKMNWRPAERSGQPLPMRVLLRYNFKKFLEQ